YITLLQGIQEYVGKEARIYYSEGCHLYNSRKTNSKWEDRRISEAVIAAEQSDVVILCLGLDSTIEGEQGDTGNAFAAGDKINLELVGKQQQLLEKVIQVGKPTILILSTGSAMAINTADEYCDAILQTWYPGGQGGKALAQILFGEHSPSGKLPVTFYKTTEELPAFTDYSMKGRTYRYMQNKALYPFGYGLNYGDVRVVDAQLKRDENVLDYQVEVDLINEGDYSTYDTIQIYIKDMESIIAVPNFSLCAFKSIHLDAKEEKRVTLSVHKKAFEVVDEEGRCLIDSRHFKLFIGTSAPDERSIELTKKKPIEIDIHL
ncbi:MAG: glycoside hydrolase family 3 C-terminal domain-containing protein, partial [Candidatus Cellulosilyticum pullistercoris]|nr:glycoside hydrolase family 3 C-terminal domain-containing protein [Candidatus Cellulosilyticum pullistercoris]